MRFKNSQLKIVLVLVLGLMLSATSIVVHAEDIESTDVIEDDNTIETSDPRTIDSELNNFNTRANELSTTQARLGDELAVLPGPEIDFNGLLRLIITWGASLAASVAIFLLILRSFQAISGTEDSNKALKTTIIKIVIGLALIFFSYQLVSFIMGIIWAT